MAKKRFVLIFVAFLIFIAMLILQVQAFAKTTTEIVHTTGIVTSNISPVREELSTNSKIIDIIREGIKLEIGEIVESSENFYTLWFKVKFNEKVEYVPKIYDNFLDNSGEPSDEKFESYIGLTACGLNLRSEPKTNASVLEVLKSNSLVIVTDVINTSGKDNSSWLKVNYNGKVGYLAKQYVNFYESTTNTSKEVGIVSISLNLNAKPNTTNSEVKEVISKGCVVEILSTATTSNNYNKWYQVRSPSGNVGWVKGRYVKVGKLSFVSTAVTNYWPNSNYLYKTLTSTINTAIERAGFESVENTSSSQEPFVLDVIFSSECCMCNMYKLDFN